MDRMFEIQSIHDLAEIKATLVPWLIASIHTVSLVSIGLLAPSFVHFFLVVIQIFLT